RRYHIFSSTNDRYRLGCLLQRARREVPDAKEHIGCGHHQYCRPRSQLVGRSVEAARHEREVPAFDEVGQPQLVKEREVLPLLPSALRQDAQAIGAAGLLRARRQRPADCCAAEQRDELAAPHHSITSSARASKAGGISMPSTLAVARLMTKSNLVGCITGRSDGLAPLRIRPV